MILVVEHKTTSKDIDDGSPYWQRLTLDDQISTYLAVARARGLDARGVLFDVIRKPDIEPFKATPPERRKYTEPKSKACPECKKKNAPPPPHYVDHVACVDGRIVTDPGGRLYANMREHDETLDEYRERLRVDIGEKPDRYYRRGVVVRLEAEVREAARDVAAVAETVTFARMRARWPRNPDACERYGRFCEYFPVCSGVTTIDDPFRYRLGRSASQSTQTKHALPLVTTSGMRAFRRCAREYFYAYELGYRPLERAAPLAFGTLFHRGLEEWWRTVDLEASFAAMRRPERANEPPPDAWALVEAEELLRGYHARWIGEPLDVLAVEHEFTTELIDPDTGMASRDWMLGGKVDAIVRERDA